MTVVATLTYAPDEKGPPASIGVVVFGRPSPLLRVLGEQTDGSLDWVPFASLFPADAHLAWAFAEWVDWLKASVTEERIALPELQQRLARPTMTALAVTEVKNLLGSATALLASEFSRRVKWPNVLPPEALGPLFEELVQHLVAQAGGTHGVRLAFSAVRTEWDIVIQGRHTGGIAVKTARPGVSPKHRAASIVRALPPERPDHMLVVTNLAAVAAALRELGVEALALGEPGYLDRLSAWLARLA